MSSETNDTPDQAATSPEEQSSGTGTDRPLAATSRQQYGIIVLAVVAAVVVGVVAVTLLFGFPGSAADDSADGTVAVVTIEGSIMAPLDEDLEDELSEIRANDSIDAVVLKMDTPGGQPATTERMYMAIQRTSEEMPVLASVQDMSASAGYYMMLPAEDIYVLPTSQIGSVGLAAGAPQPSPPVEGPSGPDKRGSNVIHTWAQQEALGDVFIETVMEQRGDRIELSREEVSTAQVFLGVNSVDNGFADEIGSLEDAVADAAERAGLETYDVTERQVGGAMAIPIFAQTEHGLVALYDENPSITDVEMVDYAWVYEPAIPHLDELEAIASPEAEEVVATAANETDDGGDDS